MWANQVSDHPGIVDLCCFLIYTDLPDIRQLDSEQVNLQLSFNKCFNSFFALKVTFCFHSLVNSLKIDIFIASLIRL